MRTIMKTTDFVSNPMYDGRASAGLKARRSFEAGTVFAIRKHFKTGDIVSISILWGDTAHTVSQCSHKFEAVFDAFTAVAAAHSPQTYAEAMMMLDQYWSAPTGSPAEDVLDMLFRTGSNETRETLISNLASALEEAQ